jgi:hypothetical protein
MPINKRDPPAKYFIFDLAAGAMAYPAAGVLDCAPLCDPQAFSPAMGTDPAQIINWRGSPGERLPHAKIKAEGKTMGDLIKRLWRWLWTEQPRGRAWLILALAFLIANSVGLTILVLAGAF